ncbi:MAG: DNA repair protein RecN [Clostridiales Family XIII bacterium]|jgi:DNA repair protein RecN (Recombination protein N)|nr:DNA repair protein RecN [Clostridiales Family XIII bacterium]
MINHISIQNFAIIQSLQAEFFPGLCVITGETGAGKSVVIEALSLALGSRADKSMVRAGADKAVITLVMDGLNGPGGAGEPGGAPEILTREVSASGKSLCKTDGEIVTLAALQEITAGLVDVHGQYDHQSLLIPERHLGLLDAYGHDLIAPVRRRVADAFAVYRGSRRALDEVVRAASASERELDFLRFEASEIDAAKLNIGEDEELISRIRVMQSSEKIFETLARVYDILAGEGADGVSALSAIGGVRDGLAGLSEYGDAFAEMAGMGAEAYYNLEELESRARAARDSLEFSQADLDMAVARLDLLDKLKAKYGGSIESALLHRDRARERLANIEDSGALRERLAAEAAQAELLLKSQALALSDLRRKAAERLESAITEQLGDLNFTDARFSAAIETDENACTETGADRVEFMLSANKGQPLLPLVKVASGGELSRIMLAFKSVTGDFDGIETMIFDEIDSGISGATASIVGEKLLKMAANHQIVCITHLPQIAAFADHHYVLEKSTDDENTYTTMREIAGQGREEEIARLLGGRNVTETTRKNAEELIRLSRGAG